MKKKLMIIAAVLVALNFGCSDDDPTSPDPTSTPAPSATSAPPSTPTPPPTDPPAATQTPFASRTFRGSVFRDAFGSTVGMIEYTIHPDRRVVGKIAFALDCESFFGGDDFEIDANFDFETSADDEGKFVYKYEWVPSPHYGETLSITCSQSGHTGQGTWSSSIGTDSYRCIGQGSWTANCISGC